MKLLRIQFVLSLLVGALFISSCGDDEVVTPTPATSSPISSFQYLVNETNFLEVTFSNFSQNADSYSWDFGDGNSSTEENPTHAYTEAGDYTVTLTASKGTEEATSNKTISIVDPNSAIKKLTGETSKVWKLSRNTAEEEYPCQVGPEDRSQIWWALGLNDPLGARVCLMEEEYIFSLNGLYNYDSKGSVFADFGVWNEDYAGQCVDATNPSQMSGPNGEDLSAWGSSEFTFEYNTSAATLTLNGLGAHVGLPKVGTDSEYATPQSSVTYNVVSLDTDGPVDKLVLETTIAGGYWRFFLVSYDNPADEPDLPGAPPTAGFTNEIDGSTVTFTNTSVNADSYMWDFGDGNTSNEESPVHTYANDGSYTVTMTATNTHGSTESTANVVISTSSVFSATTLYGDGTKSWKLAPQAAALAVGPAAGSADWWSNNEEDINVRSCAFDDEFTFDNAGNYNYVTNGDVWAEAYMGVDPPGCVDETTLSPNAAAWGAGMHTFTVTEETADAPAYVTVTGTGAFIGLAKAFNGGEYTVGPPTENGSVTYQVLSYVNDGTNEIMVLTIDISEGQAGGAFWTFTLVAQ